MLLIFFYIFDVVLSSIPKKMQPITQLYFNKTEYSKYCKDYKDYWAWNEKKNNERFKNTIAHGKNYDAKNMMHTFRLLEMAEEILKFNKIIVKRPNKEELLKIKAGYYSFEELIHRAEEKIEHIEALAMTSILPDIPDKRQVENLLFDIRNERYEG